MAENQPTVFRREAVNRISSPDNLTEYLRVTNPGIWVILAAVILLLAGIFVWASVGTLETKAEVKVIVADHAAQVVSRDSDDLAAGMPLRIDDQEVSLSAVETDEYGRSYGIAEVDLPDGTYDGTVVIEAIHPIALLLTSR